MGSFRWTGTACEWRTAYSYPIDPYDDVGFGELRGAPRPRASRGPIGAIPARGPPLHYSKIRSWL